MTRILILALVFAVAPPVASARKAAAPRGPTASEKALDSAKRAWQALKLDPKRSRYRSFWLDVARQFAAVEKRHPRSPEAAKALFDEAELYEDLSRISWIQDDVDQAVALYQKLVKRFPHDRLADDSLLAVARIQLARKNDADAARDALETLLRKNRRGDMAGQARTMLAQLPKEKPEKPAATPPKHLRVEASKDDGDSSKAKVADAADERPAPKAQVASAAAPEASSTPPEASEAPLQPVPLGKGADKDRLAALASAVKSDSDLPLSAQMGLKVHRVVIDAGHGGHDTGAVGPNGAKEKDVTLAVAEKLAAKLRAEGLEVFMTRSTDRFVSLEGRAEFANAQRADLFISVHCNAATSHALRGVETYSLNVSANRYAMRLAARENAASERSISDLQYMLADIATRADTEDSRELAHLVQHSVVQGLRARYGHVRDLGTKEALFYVLLGTRMPAILVEGSFISNPEEEKRLTDTAFQDQLAGSIAAGVERFMENRQALATAGLP